jgi:hypothetical protein
MYRGEEWLVGRVGKGPGTPTRNEKDAKTSFGKVSHQKHDMSQNIHGQKVIYGQKVQRKQIIY